MEERRRAYFLVSYAELSFIYLFFSITFQLNIKPNFLRLCLPDSHTNDFFKVLVNAVKIEICVVLDLETFPAKRECKFIETH